MKHRYCLSQSFYAWLARALLVTVACMFLYLFYFAVTYHADCGGLPMGTERKATIDGREYTFKCVEQDKWSSVR